MRFPGIARRPHAVAMGLLCLACALPAASQVAGDNEADFRLAVAEAEAGRPDRALIALERVLIRNPDADAARLLLGRVYLAMGSLDLAEQEFVRLQPRAADEGARRILASHLEEVRRLRARQRYHLSGYVEAGVGRDTNLSSSTRDFPGAVLGAFGLPGIEPTGNSIRRQDNFSALNGVVEGAYRWSPDRVAFLASDLRLRRYRDFSDYDYLLGDIVVGMQARQGDTLLTGTGFVQAFRQDGDAVEALDAERISNDRDAAGVGLEVRRPLSPRWNLALGAQLAFTRYPQNRGQDTRQVTLSAAFEHLPAAWPDAAVVARIFYGDDDARRSLNAFTDTTASRHTFGARLSVASPSNARVSWIAMVGVSRRIDDDAFARASLVATGRDDLFEAYVHGTWRIDGPWSLHPYAAHSYNRSNIALYTFRKSEGGITLRYQFR